MKKYFNEFKYVDKKYLIVLLLSVIVPIIYASLRLLWITDDGSSSYAMTSFNSYIQIFFEIFTAFLIVPLFTYKASEYDRDSNSILTAIIISSISMFFITFTFIPMMLKSMMEMNPEASRQELLSFLIISSLSDALQIVETYFISVIAIKRETIKGVLIIGLSLLLKIATDLILISRVALVDFTIVNVALSSLISILIVNAFLFTIYLFKQHRTQLHQKINFKAVLGFYKRGFYPGLDKLIGNFFYSFVTLKIVNSLGETEWNSWHLGMWIYWHVIFKITNIFKYSLLAETKNNERINSHNLTILYSYFDAFIFIILGPVLSLTVLKNLVDDPEWLRLTTITSLIMVPFMFTMAIGDKLKVTMLNTNNFKYILLNTMFSNFLIEFPVFIMLLLGFKFSYIANFSIWMSVIFFSFVLSVYFYNRILKKTNPL